MPFDLCVIGLGYVGLPLAQEACKAGLSVVGIDRSAAVVDGLAAGRSHVDDVSDEDVGQMLQAGFQAQTDASVIADSEAVLVCVPTPLSQDGGPDLSAVLDAVQLIARHITAGTLVVLESTTYPGTTEEVLRPLIESSGLRVGEDVYLAFSPERIDPGNPVFGMRNTPKVVGGCTPACTDRAEKLYSRLVEEVIRARGTREAEMAKLLENTYRHVNIALVNEMAMFCDLMDIDLWDVIRCASSKPFGFQAFYPGPGVGGHCIPIDPNYLSYKVRAQLGHQFRFVELAQEINQSMPAYVVRRVQDALNTVGKAVNGASVLILGVTYKADIADQRESPARPIGLKLRRLGAELTYHDPHAETWTVDGEELRCVPSLEEALASADITVVIQHHSDYDPDVILARARYVLDTRGRLPDAANVEHM